MDKDDPEFLEEIFHKKYRKKEKEAKKILSEKDRSKFKKSNFDKQTFQNNSPFSNLAIGKVLSISGENLIVDVNGEEYLSSLKGSLKKEKGLHKNLIAVGDTVRIKIQNNVGQIIYVEKRFSELTRIDKTGHKKQLIAVNIEQVFITASVVIPPLKTNLIDRFLISAKKGNIDPIVVINKCDLLDSSNQKEKFVFENFLKSYQPLGYTILCVSCETKIGIENLKNHMQNKSSVFIGQSGVGKSSLINQTTDHNLKTGTMIKKTYKGSHTTTKAQLLPLKNGGFCIDTPGIKSFGVWDLVKSDIIEHFHEIKLISNSCYYPDCTHQNEPKCAVKEALKEKRISSLRFESYNSLIKDILS
jgi:ribosome biogenesis GTPase / thiamine phosphate phosphatase